MNIRTETLIPPAACFSSMVLISGAALH